MSTGWMDKAMDDPMDEQRAGRQDRASTQEVGVLSEFEMALVTEAIESFTSELHEFNTSIAQDLIKMGVLLDDKTEQGVEKLLKAMGELQRLLEEEKVEIQKGLKMAAGST